MINLDLVDRKDFRSGTMMTMLTITDGATRHIGEQSKVCFSWLYLILIIIVKLSSKGPAFFKQKRIGIHGKPFDIYKFRTMCMDAEKDGPALSSETDSRVTPVGRFLRKSRLDELPQFFNVIQGDMSIVGPRPERQFFIDQIVLKAILIYDCISFMTVS